MFSERTVERQEDVVENADRILAYLAGRTLEQFERDTQAAGAIERCLARITEAIIQMGESDAALAELGVVWTEIKGLGNRLRHEYRRIEPRVIYATACNDIMPLRDAAVRALAL